MVQSLDRPEMPSRPDFLFSISVIWAMVILAFSAKAEYGRMSPLRVPVQRFQRGQAHTGVARFAVGDGGNGRAVAQVGNDHTQVFFVFAEEARGFVGDEAVAGTVQRRNGAGRIFTSTPAERRIW